jgi:hypothetical protein
MLNFSVAAPAAPALSASFPAAVSSPFEALFLDFLLLEDELDFLEFFDEPAVASAGMMDFPSEERGPLPPPFFLELSLPPLALAASAAACVAEAPFLLFFAFLRKLVSPVAEGGGGGGALVSAGGVCFL